MTAAPTPRAEGGQVSTPDKTTMGNLLALEQTCRRITEAKGCLYPGDAEGLYWLLDALRLALAASRADAARKEPPANAHGCEVGE